jgi:hypothetical protein
MSSADQHRKNRSATWLNLSLLLLFTLGSLWLADLAFRAYERQFLVPVYPGPTGDGPVNLTQLSYNDGVVARETAFGEFRILSFGDSFTHSIMEPALSYNGIVQHILDERLPGQEVSVVNLGEPGTGPNSFRAAHAYWSGIFEHQAVLFHIFLGNDVLDDSYLSSPLVWEPNVAVLKATNPFLDAGSRRVPHKFPLRMMDYAWAAWLSRQTTAAAELPEGYNWAALTELDPGAFAKAYFTFMDNVDPEKLPALLPGYQQVQLLLEQAQIIAQSGIKVAVVLGPSEPIVNDALRQQVMMDAGADPAAYDLGLPQRIIAELMRSSAPDVPLLDLTQAFRTWHLQTGEPLYFRRNTHWDQAGNQLAGERIADFLSQAWFDMPGSTEPYAEAGFVDPDWPGPQQVTDAEIRNYLQPVLSGSEKELPEVSGAARVMQLFDGITGDGDNWAMAELHQPIVLKWSTPVNITNVQVYLHHLDGRKYGILVEAFSGESWQIISDRTAEPVGGLLDITLPGTPVEALRLTGTSNSDQEHNPANAYIHIEELKWRE